MKRVSCHLIVLGLVLGAAGQAEAGFNFVTIAPPGSTESGASGINDAGQIVGTYGRVNPEGEIGFLLSGGSYTPIIGPPGSTGASVATGINDAGQIVGGYSDRPIIAGSSFGFLATSTAVPEPSALTLFGVGALGMLGYARYRWRRDAL